MKVTCLTFCTFYAHQKHVSESHLFMLFMFIKFSRKKKKKNSPDNLIYYTTDWFLYGISFRRERVNLHKIEEFFFEKFLLEKKISYDILGYTFVVAFYYSSFSLRALLHYDSVQ